MTAITAKRGRSPQKEGGAASTPQSHKYRVNYHTTAEARLLEALANGSELDWIQANDLLGDEWVADTVRALREEHNVDIRCRVGKYHLPPHERSHALRVLQRVAGGAA